MSTRNPRCVLIGGTAGSGKSSSLRNLEDPEGVLWLAFDGKDLPFGNEDTPDFNIKEPQCLDDVEDAINFVENNPDEYHTIVIDPIGFLFDMIKREYIDYAEDTRAGWNKYAIWIKRLFQDWTKRCEDQTFFFLAHTIEEIDPITGSVGAHVPVQGALKNNGGIESFFNIVVHAKVLPLNQLKKCKTHLLNPSEKEEALGIKYVYQVGRTKESVNDRVRLPNDMVPFTEPYMDSDGQMLLDVLDMYYLDKERNITEIDYE